MFCLPTSNDGSFLLSDRSAISIVTALLLDDLDDRIDMLRGVLETDPIVSSWVVHEAYNRDEVEIHTVHTASRWLDHNFASVVGPKSLVETRLPSKASLTAWRSIVSTSIRSARRARELAVRCHASTDQAYWWALVCSTKRQMDSLAKLNGHSPLQGVDWPTPPWIQRVEREMLACVEKSDPRFAAHQAIELTSSTDTCRLEGGELDRLFSTYPEVNRLVPALLGKLRRFRQLESQFTETLHREKMAAMQQLAYGASHEINNPLANISTRAQSLMRNEHDSERRRKLLAINEQAFRAYEMIADLMLFAKPPKLQLGTVHLNPLVHQVRDELEAANGRNITFRISADHETILVHADVIQLGVVIKALCLNGLEAMGGEGVIDIELSRPSADHAKISVRDSGQGLSELARRHLFDPFFSGREAGRGMGFGLSKAWRIVEQHRGRIEVSSDPARGSCFTITLPTERSAPLAAASTDAQI